MRIAIVHSFYSSRDISGENIMVTAQYLALKAAGHNVVLFSKETKTPSPSLVEMISIGMTVVTGLGKSPLREIQSFQPDIVLLNNLFPNFGSSWLKSIKVPVIGVLHNYRYWCAGGFFFRDGQECHDCLTIGNHSAVKNKCYRSSGIKSLPLALSQERRRFAGYEVEYMDRVIAITPEAAKFLMEINVPPGKIAIVTNFVGNLLNGKHLSLSEKNQRWIVTGRLSHEKGFTGLLESLPSDVEIDVVGDGPDLEVLQLKFREKKNIRFLGRIEHDKYLEMLPNYVGGFHSSLWLEHSPLTVIEFLSAGIPFIGLERNTSEKFSEYDCKISLPEFTEGFIQEAIKRIRSSYDSFSNAAVRCFDTEYSEGRWVNQMEKIFEEQIESRK